MCDRALEDIKDKRKQHISSRLNTDKEKPEMKSFWVSASYPRKKEMQGVRCPRLETRRWQDSIGVEYSLKWNDGYDWNKSERKLLPFG